MEKLERKDPDIVNTRRGMYLSLACWTFLMVLLAFFSHSQLSNFTKNIAIAEARSNFQKDQAFRLWAASHGGAYVPVTKTSPANPNLSHIPFRDILLPDNTPLTLLNPAYLVRQINEVYNKKYGVRAHATSLNPIRAENRADNWEEKALRSFEKGNREALEFTEIDGAPFLRLMQPMITQESCLKCHAAQGYKVGDIRGGVAIALPITNLLKEARATFFKQLGILIGIWLCGILFILFQGRRVLKGQQETFASTRELRQSKEQLKQSLAEKEAITATVSDIMYMFTSDGYLHWWNKSLEKISGHSTDGVRSTHALDFFVEQDQEKIARAITEVFENGSATVEARLKTVNGTRHYQMSGVRMMYDNKIYLVGTGCDLSNHRQTEKQLRSAKETAEAANQAKSQFLSNMSHELRTPLNAILGYTQIFAGDTDLSKRHQRGIKTIHQSGEHLLMLINDILDLSKVEAGKMELIPAEFNLSDFLKGVSDIISIRAEEKGLSFHYEIAEDLPLCIVADELRLRQIFLNLLSNAVKFTEKGFCRLRVNTSETSDDRTLLSVWVEDSGPGIAPEMREKIFHPFQQAGNPLKYAEGSGLGLAICRKITDLMHGELSLESSPSGGSCFCFSIRVQFSEKCQKTPTPCNTTLYSSQQKWKHPVPDNALLDEILHSIQSGDIDSVVALISILSGIDSGKYRAFTKVMTPLADDFRLSEMEMFIERIREKQT